MLDETKRDEINEKIKNHINNVFNSNKAQNELKKMSSPKMDWVSQTRNSLDIILPQLPDIAHHLFKTVPEKLNRVSNLLDIIEESKSLDVSLKENESFKEWHKKLVSTANKTSSAIGKLHSQQVSSEIQRAIKSFCGDLFVENGHSLYPDLILSKNDYSELTPQTKGTKTKRIKGPCYNGKKPSNVPDGLEIKTNNRKTMRVDAHACHAGLHLGVTWDYEVEGKFERFRINDILIAYIRLCDHTKGKRNLDTTTYKASFGHNLFISLL